MSFSLIGIDLAKNVFQVCALNEADKVVFNRGMNRQKLSTFLAQTETTTVAMEACCSSHYWGRVAQAYGHEVKLIPAQHVKPFLKGNKTDAADALAICEASRRPKIHFVPVKTAGQQDLQLLSRHRSRLIAQRTAASNQLRAFAAEYGVVFSKGFRKLLSEVPDVLEVEHPLLTPVAREVISELYGEIFNLQERITSLQDRLANLASQQEAYARLLEVPGFGRIVAAAYLGALGDGRQFGNGRQSAAWLGLVPRQHGTGGRVQLMGITKRGDRELRAMLIHGARAVIRWCDRRDDALGHWLRQLRARRGTHKAIVALANKMARIAWAVVAKGERFDMARAFARP